ILLKYPNLARYEAAPKAGVPALAVTSGNDKSKGKGKAIIGPSTPGKGKGKAVAGPSTPSKKRTVEESSVKKEKASKRKKKKTKETPKPSGRVDTTPYLGPIFNSILY
ncbi:hypothetical protein PENSOL_c168G09960, partial [Penicillium solitum]